VTPYELRKISQSFESITFDKGQNIVLQNEIATDFFIILRGKKNRNVFILFSYLKRYYLV
jgi:hypothetical protein